PGDGRCMGDAVTVAGLVLTLVGAIGYFVATVELAARYPWLRNHAAPSVVVVAIGLVLAVRGVVPARRRLLPGLLLGLSVVVAGAFAAMLWVVTAVAPVAGPPVGTPAPGFALADQGGKTIRLDDFRGKPVLLVFYRGHW